MPPKSNRNTEDPVEEVSQEVRDAALKADLKATRNALHDLPEKSAPDSPAFEYIEKIKKLVPGLGDGDDDGEGAPPLLQENLFEALELLKIANMIETTKEMVMLRDRITYELGRIADEKGNIMHSF